MLSDVDPEDWAALGRPCAYVEYVGVRRAWRGRHLAQSLLASTLRAHVAEGLEVAVLDVDSDKLNDFDHDDQQALEQLMQLAATWF